LNGETQFGREKMENTYDIKSEDQLYLVTHVETKQDLERKGELIFTELNNAVRDPFNTEHRVLPLNTRGSFIASTGYESTLGGDDTTQLLPLQFSVVFSDSITDENPSGDEETITCPFTGVIHDNKALFSFPYRLVNEISVISEPIPSPTPTPILGTGPISSWMSISEPTIHLTPDSPNNLTNLVLENVHISVNDMPVELSNLMNDPTERAKLITRIGLVRDGFVGFLGHTDTSADFYRFSENIVKHIGSGFFDDTKKVNLAENLSSFEAGEEYGSVLEASLVDDDFDQWRNGDDVKLFIQILKQESDSSLSEVASELFDVNVYQKILKANTKVNYDDFISDYSTITRKLIKRGDFDGQLVSTDNGTSLSVNLSNGVTDIRSEFTQLSLGNKENFLNLSEVEAIYRLYGSSKITHINLKGFNNLFNLVISKQENLLEIYNINEIGSNSTSDIKLRIEKSGQDEVTLTNNNIPHNLDSFVYPSNLKDLTFVENSNLMKARNVPNTLTRLYYDALIENLSSDDTQNEFDSGSCNSTLEEDATTYKVRPFSGVRTLSLGEVNSDVPCMFPFVMEFSAISNFDDSLPKTELDVRYLPINLSRLTLNRISSENVCDLSLNPAMFHLISINSDVEFVNFPPSLTQITLEGNTKTSFTAADSSFPNLNYLNLTGLNSQVVFSNTPILEYYHHDQHGYNGSMTLMPESLRNVSVRSSYGNNMISGFHVDQSFPNLEELDVTGNIIMNDINIVISSAPKLQKLYAGNNTISGELDLSTITDLTHLGLEENSWIESLILPVGLQYLNIKNVYFEASLPNLSGVAENFELHLGDLGNSNTDPQQERKITLLNSIPSSTNITLDVTAMEMPDTEDWKNLNIISLSVGRKEDELGGKVDVGTEMYIPSSVKSLYIGQTQLISLNVANAQLIDLNTYYNSSLETIIFGVQNNLLSWINTNNLKISVIDGDCPKLKSLNLANSQISEVEVFSGLETLNLAGCKNIKDSSSKITFNDSSYINFKKFDIRECEFDSAYIGELFDTLFEKFGSKPNQVEFDYVGNGKRPEANDENYETLVSNGWKITPKDPSVANYASVSAGQVYSFVSFDQLPQTEEEKLYIKTDDTITSVKFGDFETTMMGVYPHPFVFGNQTWQFYEIGVEKEVSLGNMKGAKVTWYGYGSSYMSIYGGYDMINLNNLNCIPHELKVKVVQAESSSSADPYFQYYSFYNMSQEYLVWEDNNGNQIMPSQYDPRSFGNNKYVFDFSEILSSKPIKLSMFSLVDASGLMSSVANPFEIDEEKSTVQGSNVAGYYGGKLYIKDIDESVDFMKFEFANGQMIPLGYSNGVQFIFRDDCTIPDMHLDFEYTDQESFIKFQEEHSCNNLDRELSPTSYRIIFPENVDLSWLTTKPFLNCEQSPQTRADNSFDTKITINDVETDITVNHFEELPLSKLHGWSPIGGTFGKDEEGNYIVAKQLNLETLEYGETGHKLEIVGKDGVTANIDNFTSVVGAPWIETDISQVDNTYIGSGYGSWSSKYLCGGSTLNGVSFANYMSDFVRQTKVGFGHYLHELKVTNVNFTNINVKAIAMHDSMFGGYLYNGGLHIENVNISGKFESQTSNCFDMGILFSWFYEGNSVVKNVNIDAYMRAGRFTAGLLGAALASPTGDEPRTHLFENVTIDGYMNGEHWPQCEMSWGGHGSHGGLNMSAFIGSVSPGNHLTLKNVTINADASCYHGDYGGQGGYFFGQVSGSAEKPTIINLDNVNLNGSFLYSFDGGTHASCYTATKTYGDPAIEYPNPNNPSGKTGKAVLPYDPLDTSLSEQDKIDLRPPIHGGYRTEESLAEDPTGHRPCSWTGLYLVGRGSYNHVTWNLKDFFIQGEQMFANEIIDASILWVSNVYINDVGPYYATESSANNASTTSTSTKVEVSSPGSDKTFFYWKPDDATQDVLDNRQNFNDIIG
jgi:hypothetical protein